MSIQSNENTAIFKRTATGITPVREAASREISVCSTRDYTKFRFMKENRPIYPGHLSSLTRSIQESGYLEQYPIQVVADGNAFTIIDGQHRFTACRNLDLPVLYIVREATDSVAAIRIANAYMKSWKDEDYLGHFVQIGHPAYLKLKKFMEDFQLPIYPALAVMSGNVSGVHRIREKFRTGDLKFTDADVVGAAQIMGQVNDIRYFHDRLKSLRKDRGFLAALITATTSQHYDHQRMLTLMPKSLLLFVKCSSVGDYLTLIGEVYNRGKREGNRIVFGKTGSKSQ